MGHDIDVQNEQGTFRDVNSTNMIILTCQMSNIRFRMNMEHFVRC